MCVCVCVSVSVGGGGGGGGWVCVVCAYLPKMSECVLFKRYSYRIVGNFHGYKFS